MVKLARHGFGAVLVVLTLVAGCITDSQLPAPALGVDAGQLSCASRYPLLDDANPADSQVTFGSEGLTKSSTDFGAGARFHLAFTFRNRGDRPVRFVPAAVRLRDALGVDLRMVEVKEGDAAIAEASIAPGQDATVDLFFVGLGLKLTPQRMSSFNVTWPYAIGDVWWSRFTKCQLATEPKGEPGFGPWVPVHEPGDTTTERAKHLVRAPEPAAWPLNFSR